AATFAAPRTPAPTPPPSSTVPRHGCTIRLTQTPSVTTVRNLSTSPARRSSELKNTGDFFNVSGSVSDDKLGSIGSFGPLAPGASARLTTRATLTGGQTNTGAATGTFDDSVPTTATATASATVTSHGCNISLTKT